MHPTPDFKRCQRCSEAEPTVIATEVSLASGPRSVSLCEACRAVVEKDLPGRATFESMRDASLRMQRESARDPVLRRYAFLTGYALRTDAEEKEVHELQAQFLFAGQDPGWPVVPREIPPEEVEDLEHFFGVCRTVLNSSDPHSFSCEIERGGRKFILRLEEEKVDPPKFKTVKATVTHSETVEVRVPANISEEAFKSAVFQAATQQFEATGQRLCWKIDRMTEAPVKESEDEDNLSPRERGRQR